MGFRQGGCMSVWSTEESKSGNTTKVRLSSSRKNKTTNEYEQDFSGFCTFIGKAHNMAKNLRPRDRIKLLECDVGTNYDKVKQKEYVNYKVFDFEMVGGASGGGSADGKTSASAKKTAFEVDSGEHDPDDLPF